MHPQFAEYAAHGWKLCAIEHGSKGPHYAGWNVRPITDPDTAAVLEGVGLLHALSGTCCLDIDHMDAARKWLGERGVDVDVLWRAPDAVRISSGRPGRGKLLYKLSKPLRTIKPPGSGVELRCATAEGKSVQDVLPPTIHPDTKRPYIWEYGDPLIGDWRVPPPIPAVLLGAWRGEIGSTPVTEDRGASHTPEDTNELRALIAGRDPNMAYDAWIKVGMALHHETNGSAEGLRLWDEWSRNGKTYKGIEDLRLHWLSFSSRSGKRVTTGASLRAESVASADDFDIVEQQQQPTAQPPDGSPPQVSPAEAKKQLENRLIYVRAVERYFDVETHKVIQTESALQHLFMPSMPKQRGSRIDPVRVLKESKTKTIVDGLGFHPGEGAIFADGSDKYANLYRARLPDPLMPTAHELEMFEWLMNRLPDPVFRKYLRSFLAHVVQQPGVKIKSAPLLWSEITGNGKTTVLRTIPALLVGREYSREVGYSLLESSFNDFLLHAWHINLTEFRAGSRAERADIANKLKPWITDDTIAIHPKGLTAYTIPNKLFVTATSNEPDAAPIDGNDRRWCVCEMEAPAFTDSEKAALSSVLETPRSPGVLRWIFLNEPLNGFNPNSNAPQTAARAEMIEASLSDVDEALRGAFERREGPFVRDAVELDEIVRYCKTTLGRPTNVHRLGRIMRNYPFHGDQVQCKTSDGRRYRIWVFHNKINWKSAPRDDLVRHALGDEIVLDSLLG